MISFLFPWKTFSSSFIWKSVKILYGTNYNSLLQLKGLRPVTSRSPTNEKTESCAGRQENEMGEKGRSRKKPQNLVGHQVSALSE